MHPARLLDKIVSVAAKWPAPMRKVVKVFIAPFVPWRLRLWARALAQLRFLPSIPWEEVEKHGKNVVYATQTHIDVYSKEEKIVGVVVVDYTHRTIRTVLAAPEKYHKVASTF